MVKLTVELEMPDDELAAKLRIEGLCRKNGWELLSLERSADHPACPNCGMPMTWSRELQAFSCSHPE